MATTAEPTTQIPTGTWVLDPVHSSAGFAVRHMVVATFRGRFEDFDATLVADEHGARLTGTVRADSIVVKDENLAGHLRSPDFFDVEAHPEITYVADEIRRDGERVVAVGDLTIKGHTERVESRGEITGPAVAAGEVEKLGLTLEASIDRTAFGLSWNAPLPRGGVALGDEVKLVVELELARAEEA